MPEPVRKRLNPARAPRRASELARPGNPMPAAAAVPVSSSLMHMLVAELGYERLAFLEAECEREYWRNLLDALRHIIDLRMRAQFRSDQRRALARVRSLLRREQRRLAHRNAGADTRLAVQRVIEQIESGHDNLLKQGLLLLRAIDARDTATVERLRRWKEPQPPARRVS